MPLTASQIVSTALQIAKCPGFTQQGGQALNLVLQDLYLIRDLKINRVTSFINVQANNRICCASAVLWLSTPSGE